MAVVTKKCYYSIISKAIYFHFYSRKESNSSSSTSSEMFSLGDISEADERVKKFYGLLPKQQQQNFEVKTVRMVKRDSKERSRSQDSPIGKH